MPEWSDDGPERSVNGWTLKFSEVRESRLGEETASLYRWNSVFRSCWRGSGAVRLMDYEVGIPSDEHRWRPSLPSVRRFSEFLENFRN